MSARSLIARPSSSIGARPGKGSNFAPPRDPVTRWHSANDAIIAASRMQKQLQKVETGGPVAKVDPKPRVPEKSVTVHAPAPGKDVIAIGKSKQQIVQRYGPVARHAAKTGDATTLRQLMTKYPGVHDAADENEVTPLLLAAAYGHMTCVEMVCDEGASLDRANVWGSTALINAAHNAHAGCVKLLILNGASIVSCDKDGTALDNALKRLHKLVRGLAQALDKDHPDKPALQAAGSALGSLAKDASRGHAFKVALESALSQIRPVLAAAAAAAAAAASEGGADKVDEKEGASKKKGADAGDPPDPGLLALYHGCSQYIRCIEMLRDPATVRKEEKLLSGREFRNKAEAGATTSAAGDAVANGLTQKVGRIRGALGLDVGLSIPESIRQANDMMAFETEGSLPNQTDRLVRALGLQ